MAVEAPAPRPKRRRLLLWIAIGVPLALLLAAAVALPALLNVENYREQIESGLRDATGWEAELGEIDFSVWRGMALTVNPARLAAPGDSSSLAIERIDVRAELWPLLRGKLHVKSVVLNGPVIRLVRHDEQNGWVVPAVAADPATASDAPVAADVASDAASDAPDETESASSFEVAVDSIRVEGGRLHLEDRVTDPPLVIDLHDVSAVVRPSAGTIEGAAELGQGDGRLEWEGRLQETLTVSLEDFRTDALIPWIGDELIHPGGLLQGEVEIGTPLSITGHLDAEGLTLLAGEKPFDRSGLEFQLSSAEGGWRLDRLQVDADDVRVVGAGTLLPDVALELELPDTPLEALLDASESVLPLPLEVEPPGRVAAQLRVDQPEGGELTYEARGTMSAAAFKPGEQLPVARDIRAEFELDREGKLEVHLLDGQVAGGPLRGTARLESIDPPGRLVFEGGLQDAILGQLLGGFVGPAGSKVTGPTGIDAQMALDLSQPQIDARALSGRLDFEASEIHLPGWDVDNAIRNKLDEKLGLLSQLVDRDPGDAAGSDDAVRELLETMRASVDFDRWPWGLEDLSLTAQGLKVRGDGSFDPLAGTVDLRFDGTFNRDRTARLVEKYKNLKYLVNDKGRLVVPLTLQGAMLSPSIHVELDELLDKVQDEQKEEVKDKLLRGLADRLKKRD